MVVESAVNRIRLARELLRAVREEFARAEEAKGGAAVIGLRNSCGKGWLATLEAANSFFIMQGVPEAELPKTDRGRRLFVQQQMPPDMRRHYDRMRTTFHIDGYYEGIVEFEHMPDHFDELEEFIESIEALGHASPGGGL